MRILALEVRAGMFGYVCIEGATRLLDWGLFSHGKIPKARAAVARRRIATLLDLSLPAVVVIRKRWSEKLAPVSLQASISIIEVVQEETRRRSIGTRFVSADSIESFFAERGCMTKHAISVQLAEWFEELTWKLPPKRKLWDGERANALIFDAAAAALVFFTGN